MYGWMNNRINSIINNRIMLWSVDECRNEWREWKDKLINYLETSIPLKLEVNDHKRLFYKNKWLLRNIKFKNRLISNQKGFISLKIVDCKGKYIYICSRTSIM